MRKLWMVAGLVALGFSVTGGVVGLATGGDEPKGMPPATKDPKPSANAKEDTGGERPGPSLAEKLDRVKTEYETALQEYRDLYRGSTIPEENQVEAERTRPDFPAVVRRISELAETEPENPATRDAMLWVIGQTLGNIDSGRHAGQFTLAASWLVRHFGDDPDAVRLGLEMDNAPDAYRDHLLLCFYASAKGRESKGLARLALAQYLERKAMFVEAAKKVEGRRILTYSPFLRPDGTSYDKKMPETDEQYAYNLHLKQCDPDYLRAEAERLYEEVISTYTDVPYITMHQRQLEALLKQPEPKRYGVPLSDEYRRRLEKLLARRVTLGQAAKARLYNWHKLAKGKPAPEIEGTDLLGKPVKLSDYRGKIVALVFWGSWCGPCMREIPREKALVERMKGRPFAMLGVNTDTDAETAREVMEAEGISWPNWHDGKSGERPITRRYQIRSYPTIYVVDAEGKIRSKDSSGTALDDLAEKLVSEVEEQAASADR